MVAVTVVGPKWTILYNDSYYPACLLYNNSLAELVIMETFYNRDQHLRWPGTSMIASSLGVRFGCPSRGTSVDATLIGTASIIHAGTVLPMSFWQTMNKTQCLVVFCLW